MPIAAHSRARRIVKRVRNALRASAFSEDLDRETLRVVDQADERPQGGFVRGSLRHADSLAGIVAAGTSITRGR
jgi:hypothetical protein